MKNIFYFILMSFLVSCTVVPKRNFASEHGRILVFGQTNRPAHRYIVPVVIPLLVRMFEQNGYEALGSQDPEIFTSRNLSEFDLVVFLDLSNGILNDDQKVAIEKFVSNGNGLMALHASIAAGNDWEWFKKNLGTSFLDHPPIQNAKVKIERTHPSTDKIPESWIQSDEWYNYTSQLNSEFKVLASIDKTTYSGGKIDNHPITWIREAEGFKVWYTAMGHDESLYANFGSPFMQHILEAAKWMSTSDLKKNK